MIYISLLTEQDSNKHLALFMFCLTNNCLTTMGKCCQRLIHHLINCQQQYSIFI